jgi:hypothetical protein
MFKREKKKKTIYEKEDFAGNRLCIGSLIIIEFIMRNIRITNDHKSFLNIIINNDGLNYEYEQ